MDPLALVWVTSVLGAGAFSSAGYVLGQRGAARPAAKAIEPAVVPPPKAVDPVPELRFGDEAPPDEDATRVGAAPDQIARSAVPSASHHVAKEQLEALKTELETARAELAAARIESESALETARLADAAKAGLEKALAEAKAAVEKARAEETSAKAAADKARAAEAAAKAQLGAAASSVESGQAELAKQLEVVRNELRNEVVARASESARADELADRLAKASEEAASLRHKLALQVRSIPPKSMPANGTARVSAPPRAPANDQTAILEAEVARLAADNRELRARLLSSVPPKRPTSRQSAPDLDLDVYMRLVERLKTSTGTQCAVIADEVGSLLAGSGDLAEGLAAFGAYIRDASARTERLLPLEGVEEIDIRDRNGSVLSTRVLIRSPAELSLVVLGQDSASILAAKKVTEEALRAR